MHIDLASFLRGYAAAVKQVHQTQAEKSHVEPSMGSFFNMYELNIKIAANQMGVEDLMTALITVFLIVLMISCLVALLWKAVRLGLILADFLENEIRRVFVRIGRYPHLFRIRDQQDDGFFADLFQQDDPIHNLEDDDEGDWEDDAQED
jgi:hypothetical protein